MLTLKVVTLLWLSSQSEQGVRIIHIRNEAITQNGVKIRCLDILKTKRPGFQQKELNIKSYAPDIYYTQKPLKAATASIIARLVKGVMLALLLKFESLLLCLLWELLLEVMLLWRFKSWRIL